VLAQHEVLDLKSRSLRESRPDSKQQLDQKCDHRTPPLLYEHGRVIAQKVFGRYTYFPDTDEFNFLKLLTIHPIVFAKRSSCMAVMNCAFPLIIR
jgi:hypothetical protein